MLSLREPALRVPQVCPVALVSASIALIAPPSQLTEPKRHA
jgi:hypothetical protein